MTQIENAIATVLEHFNLVVDALDKAVFLKEEGKAAGVSGKEVVGEKVHVSIQGL